MNNTAKEFLEFVKNFKFDRSTVKPWERKTLLPYLGYDKCLSGDAETDRPLPDIKKSSL